MSVTGLYAAPVSKSCSYKISISSSVMKVVRL